jgi:large subunit ribosomal protein L18
MNKAKKKTQAVKRRAIRVRARLHGTATRPRLSVRRSLKHIYVQLINDETGVTLASASDKDVKADGMKPVEVAKEVGKLIAQKAAEAKITEAIFDRGDKRYHGRVAAIAEGAREQGLKI